MTVLAASVHKPFLRKVVNFPPLSMACIQLKRVINFPSTQPFCWDVLGVVNLNSIPIPSCLQALLKATFSPALSQCRYCTWILYLLNVQLGPSPHLLNLIFILKRNSTQSWYCLLQHVANAFYLQRLELRENDHQRIAIPPVVLSKQQPFCKLHPF